MVKTGAAAGSTSDSCTYMTFCAQDPPFVFFCGAIKRCTWKHDSCGDKTLIKENTFATLVRPFRSCTFWPLTDARQRAEAEIEHQRVSRWKIKRTSRQIPQVVSIHVVKKHRADTLKSKYYRKMERTLAGATLGKFGFFKDSLSHPLSLSVSLPLCLCVCVSLCLRCSAPGALRGVQASTFRDNLNKSLRTCASGWAQPFHHKPYL